LSLPAPAEQEKSFKRVLMKKTFFFSDVHFGLQEKSQEEAKTDLMLSLFDQIEDEGRKLFMVGDILDYWMEYRHAIPKGYIRFFNGIDRLVRKGIEVVYIAGNHDFYLGNYFDQELGVKTHYGHYEETINNKRFYIVHGDGIGKGDTGYKLFKTLVRNNFNLGIFRLLHPNIGLGLMSYLSRLSRRHTYTPKDLGEKERLIVYANELLAQKDFDYFVCGHRHIVKLHLLQNQKSYYVNLGTWIGGMPTYGVFDGIDMKLVKAKTNETLFTNTLSLVS
jgi:UDP-2,3-diacylglucosamine hydrolase